MDQTKSAKEIIAFRKYDHLAYHRMIFHGDSEIKWILLGEPAQCALCSAYSLSHRRMAARIVRRFVQHLATPFFIASVRSRDSEWHGRLSILLYSDCQINNLFHILLSDFYYHFSRILNMKFEDQRQRCYRRAPFYYRKFVRYYFGFGLGFSSAVATASIFACFAWIEIEILFWSHFICLSLPRV